MEPNSVAPGTETKVLTVPLDLVNVEIANREAFGWTVLNTSARSFATDVSTVGGGTSVGGIAVGGASSKVTNKHLVDVTLQRQRTSQNQRRAELEAQFDAVVVPRDSVSGKVFAVIFMGIGFFIGLMAEIAWLVWAAFLVGGPLGIWAGNAGKQKREMEQVRARAKKSGLAEEAKNIGVTGLAPAPTTPNNELAALDKSNESLEFWID